MDGKYSDFTNLTSPLTRRLRGALFFIRTTRLRFCLWNNRSIVQNNKKNKNNPRLNPNFLVLITKKSVGYTYNLLFCYVHNVKISWVISSKKLVGFQQIATVWYIFSDNVLIKVLQIGLLFQKEQRTENKNQHTCRWLWLVDHLSNFLKRKTTKKLSVFPISQSRK